MSQEECIGALDATYIIESLDERIASLKKLKGSDVTIKDMEKVTEAIKKVVYQSDVRKDKICFVLKKG